ncbi:MAG: RDD family protein, partial [Elusimicrobiales bacterium]|nr:RDD family protein [Elusimicrobiales bacterium]
MDDKFEFDPNAAKKDIEPESEPIEPKNNESLNDNLENTDTREDNLTSAGFHERLIAYVIDALPFVALCYWTLSKLVIAEIIVFNPANELKWKLIWIFLYLIYETIFSSGGRATLGKYIMGIRVRNADGNNLSVGKAFLRSVSYFLSSLPLNAGFLMALFTKKKRALHDFIGSSRVIRIREKSSMAEGFIIVFSFALLAFFIGSWVNQSFLTLDPSEKKQIVLAKRSLSRIGQLEEIHKKRYGGYTSDIKRLIVLSHNPRVIQKDLMKNIQIDSLMISSNGRDYVISAKAKNWRKSEVKINSV